MSAALTRFETAELLGTVDNKHRDTMHGGDTWLEGHIACQEPKVEPMRCYRVIHDGVCGCGGVESGRTKGKREESAQKVLKKSYRKFGLKS